MNWGNLAEGTLRREVGCRIYGTIGEKDDGTIELKKHLNETSMDSANGEERA